MEVETGPRLRLLCPRCVSDPDFTGGSYFRGSGRSLMAPPGSPEGVYFCMAFLAGSVADEG
jgi:hypothetical protein